MFETKKLDHTLYNQAFKIKQARMVEREGFEPSMPLSGHTRFPITLFRPLRHLSDSYTNYSAVEVSDSSAFVDFGAAVFAFAAGFFLATGFALAVSSVLFEAFLVVDS